MVIVPAVSFGSAALKNGLLCLLCLRCSYSFTVGLRYSFFGFDSRAVDADGVLAADRSVLLTACG